MIRRFQEYLQTGPGVFKSTGYILAVSGGRDSMAMWHLFRKSELKYVVAHCNFGLRGHGSEADEALVRAFAAPDERVFFKRFQTRTYASSKGLSIQMAARELRYGWLDELRLENKAGFVATAHHFDDQIETFFVQLMRGGSLHSMAGIPVLTENRIRPLMFATRNELTAFVTEEGVPYRDDESNASDDYLRNRIRHRLIPVLSEAHCDFRQKVMQVMSEINGLNQRQNAYLEKVIAAVASGNEEERKLDIQKLKDLDDAVLFLKLLLRKLGFHADVAGMVRKSLSGQSGKVFYSAGYRLDLGRQFLFIRKLKVSDQTAFEIPKPVLPDMETERLKGELLIGKGVDIQLPDNYTAYLDYDKLAESIIFRKWKRGDYFYPLGMKGKKKLSDFFTDNKFSLQEKEEQWIMTSGSEICWLPGKRLDERYKITARTKNILKLRFKASHDK